MTIKMKRTASVLAFGLLGLPIWLGLAIGASAQTAPGLPGYTSKLTGKAFQLSLDEERIRYRFGIEHPEVPVAAINAGASPEVMRAHALQRAVAMDQKRLEKVKTLAQLDPTYPGYLAEGVILYRLGRVEAAAVAFGRHLSAHPDGPWTLRAQNYLKASLEAR